MRLFDLPGQILEFLVALRNVGFPSGEGIPKELLSFNVLTVVRGLATRFIVSTNLDWIWPYWMQKQFYAHQADFVARGFQPATININHRNWTAIGNLNSKREAIVDPRGLLTPWINRWSVDVWHIENNKATSAAQLPADQVSQIAQDQLPFIKTKFSKNQIQIEHEYYAAREGGEEWVCHDVTVSNLSALQIKTAWGLAFRPYNTEGLDLIYQIKLFENRCVTIDDSLAAVLSEKPDQFIISNLSKGDSAFFVDREDLHDIEGKSHVGVCNATAVYRLELSGYAKRTYQFRYPMLSKPYLIWSRKLKHADLFQSPKLQVQKEWEAKVAEGVSLQFPEERLNEVFKINKAYLLLMDDGDEITPGPSTYHHFWFRDAAYLVSALDLMGYHSHAERILKTYPSRQRWNGFFYSQKGEWDSNGQAIWSLWQHYRLTRNQDYLKKVYPSIAKGAHWIQRKRLSNLKLDPGYKGLMPPGLSAEHFGVDDYYYWDDFWALAGLRDAIYATQEVGKSANTFQRYYHSLHEAMESSFQFIEKKLGDPMVSISPSRRMDSAAIGVLSAYYPTRLYSPRDERIAGTTEWIINNNFLKGGFFHDVNHSGYGTYLTLHVAQMMLGQRRGDKAYEILNWLLSQAMSTWTWPEAIHPNTGGGCIGDGHHGWMVADLLVFLRNGLLYENKRKLLLMRMFPIKWLELQKPIVVKNAPTVYGPVSFDLSFKTNKHLVLNLAAEWHGGKPPIDIELNVPLPIKSAKVDGVVSQFLGNQIHFSKDAKQVEIELE